ncbi:hypothetical protein KP509_13G086000 [Ceratopteris richardii]|uniref:LEM domain-containing protein n=1 Tax=Ceratopteris richardii TaxID=49495 RepID=A0A8T2TN55_CERRI|nr:hypothetical protein KP509_13G086000 [Ceratopteris richardii]
MANISVEDILQMKTYQLKEYLTENNAPVPRRLSKEFLQTAALQTHAELAAEAARRKIMTRRRSKLEESNSSSTFSGMYGRSTSLSRISPSRSSILLYPPSELPSSRKKKQSAARSQDSAKQEVSGGDVNALQEGDDVSYSSYSALMQSTTPSSPFHPNVDVDKDLSKQLNDEGERRKAPALVSVPVHGEAKTDATSAHCKAAMGTQSQKLGKAVSKSADHPHDHSKISKGIFNRGVLTRIMRVNDDSEKHRGAKNPLAKRGPDQDCDASHSQGSRLQRLKRSGSMIVSQMNERVIKRLRQVPNPCRLHVPRPSPYTYAALLMCTAMCVAAIGAASYWYHVKKLEEQRAARKKWLW